MLKTSNLTLAKIVTTPTQFSWSQAYNAGNLFALLSLKKPPSGNQEELETKDSLSLLGKETFEVLEQEYFSLETKNLDSIKQAVLTTLKNLTPEFLDCFIVVSVTGNVVYLLAKNNGKILLKRSDTLTTILSPSAELTTASGNLNNNDLLIMETNSFSDIIPNSALLSSFDHITLSDLAETLTPKIHERENANACCMFVEYKSMEDLREDGNGGVPKDKKIFPPQFKNLLPSLSLSHSKKILLTIAIIIAAIFIASVHFAKQKQRETAMSNLFQKIYPPALQKYNEGEGLKQLNQNIAKSDFRSAQKLLIENEKKFDKNSQEEKQTLALLDKVNKELNSLSTEKIAASLDRSKINVSVENGSGLEGAAGKAADFLKTKGYKISSTGNADNYKYIGITIETKSSTKAYLDLLKKDLSANYTVTKTSSDLSNSSAADAVVIIGK